MWRGRCYCFYLPDKSVLLLLKVELVFQVCWLASRSGISEESRQHFLTTCLAIGPSFHFWEWRPRRKAGREYDCMWEAQPWSFSQCVFLQNPREGWYLKERSCCVCFMNMLLLLWKPSLEYRFLAAPALWVVHGDLSVHRAEDMGAGRCVYLLKTWLFAECFCYVWGLGLFLLICHETL